MTIVCIGGGPAGLYFALLTKKLRRHHDVTVVERNRPYDTFGWGVVFSDATMDNMRAWDAETAGDGVMPPHPRPPRRVRAAFQLCRRWHVPRRLGAKAVLDPRDRAVGLTGALAG